MNFKEAITDPCWCITIDAKLKALEENGNWELTSLHARKKAIGSHWIFKTKLMADDVSNDFLHDDMEEVYMKPPLSYTKLCFQIVDNWYTKELLKEGCLNNKPYKLPMEPNLKLQADIGTYLPDRENYRRAIIVKDLLSNLLGQCAKGSWNKGFEPMDLYGDNQATLYIAAVSTKVMVKIILTVGGDLAIGLQRESNNDWLSFSKCGGAGIPCCYSKNLDSLKNWNNNFFWIDASICPIFVLWFEGLSVKRDPLPFDDIVDLPLIDQLNEGRCPIKRKYPESFVIIGSAGCISPSNETLQLVDHAITDELRSVAGKRKRKVAFNANLPPLVKKVRGSSFDVGSELATAATDDFVSSFVTPTLKHKYEDESDENVKTRPASDRYVVFTSSSEPLNTNLSPTLKVTSPVSYV
ncbi:gypsy type transposase [Tanacetum coccineum]